MSLDFFAVGIWDHGGADLFWDSSSTTSSSSSPLGKDSAAAHQNEGFLKNMWHTLTHQHDNLKEDKSKGGAAKVEEEKKAEEEPKKEASGSG